MEVQGQPAMIRPLQDTVGSAVRMEADILQISSRVFLIGRLFPIRVWNLNLAVNPDSVCSFVSVRFWRGHT